MSSGVGYWANRWVRTPGTALRFHLGAAWAIGETPVIDALCGIRFEGSGQFGMRNALERCPADCDESRHCGTCARVLARRLSA